MLWPLEEFLYAIMYDLTILNLNLLRELFTQFFINKIREDFLIPDSDYTDVYDWLVQEAVQRVIHNNFSSNVIGHFRHDVYLCIYEDVEMAIGFRFETLIIEQLTLNKVSFSNFSKIKLLVLGNVLLIAREQN